MNKKLICFRGCSGSGKSFAALTLAEELFMQGIKVFHIETDQYWIDLEGKYRWNPKYLGLAHQWCLANVVRQFEILDFEVVIVSNTFTTLKELQPYLDFANSVGIEIEIKEPNTSWKFDAEECFKRNRHNVPLEVIKKQISRWETL